MKKEDIALVMIERGFHFIANGSSDFSNKKDVSIILNAFRGECEEAKSYALLDKAFSIPFEDVEHIVGEFVVDYTDYRYTFPYVHVIENQSIVHVLEGILWLQKGCELLEATLEENSMLDHDLRSFEPEEVDNPFRKQSPFDFQKNVRNWLHGFKQDIKSQMEESLFRKTEKQAKEQFANRLIEYRIPTDTK